MADRMSSDVETTAPGQIVHPRQRVQLAKKTMWRSLRDNPKVLLIAFFASFGGLEYGYQQGVLGQSLVMTRFTHNFPSVVQSSAATGWLTSVLQLGGILGSLSAGILGEIFSRKYTMFFACCWVILGSYLYVGAQAGNPSLLYAGRFFTGLGVGLFSGVGPLYNAELAAPEMRGLLVSFYQFATILGIMLSFWVGYGSNYIGGTGETQSDLAWRLPSIIQGIPAVFLAIGIWWMPFSPRWLVKVGRDDEAKSTLAWLAKLPIDDELVQVEYLEIKAEAVFEERAFAKAFPKLAEKEHRSIFMNQVAQYANCFRTMDNFKRVCTAWLIMFFQQWSGIDAIIYYASNVFVSLGLTGGTIALLATGVTGVVFLVSTIPAMLIIDKVGRKPMLLVGSVVMFVSMVMVGIIVAKFHHDWPAHATAGWVAVAFIWVYIAGFGATWGPVSWTLVSEIFPLSIRAKGASIGASSNWINNFAIAFFVPPMLETWEWGTYIFFAAFLFVGIIWVYFFLPETKNATLEEMDRVFKSHTGERDAELLREAQRDVGLTAFLEGNGSGNEAKHMVQEKSVIAPFYEGATPLIEEDSFLSPGGLSSVDEYASNPRFLDLQEELRTVLFTGAASLAPSRNNSPAPSEPVNVPALDLSKQSLDFTRVSIPKVRLINYLKNWISECAPYLDKFDEARHFGVQVPIVAQGSPALFYAVLAFSARQTERKTGLEKSHDSLELYQESIRLLAPSLQAKDPNVLVTVCILACLELMSVSPRDWRRHIEGCAALFDSFNINGFHGGLLQAVFWCYARMELCGAIVSDGAESTLLHIDKWTPTMSESPGSKEGEEELIKGMFFQKSRLAPDMHANWAVYLCAKTCDLACRRTRYLELGELDKYDTRPPMEQWDRLWDELQYWNEQRPPEMLPIKTTGTGDGQIFPEIFFAHWAAISSNQLYHTACIIMLEMKFAGRLPQPSMPHWSAVWHSRRICGISLTNPHSANLINAIQPLYIAGKLLTHRSEHLLVARLFKIIDKTTGWGAMWRLKDLERAWGYEPGEIILAMSSDKP
ncbi:hypothetical protein V495_02923 [Pseudogymnoascus sp. VKM F-4514 (FW-929)]|nr:hypothetical protein V495_02923 [Pseudogymnoascus sp. VKM F-4514 (FW-929)]KFY61157.1 hypothetical protein V497_03103 [Pseudogymnoascus sp. VKM F-4516 (FW-969)]